VLLSISTEVVSQSAGGPSGEIDWPTVIAAISALFAAIAALASLSQARSSRESRIIPELVFTTRDSLGLRVTNLGGPAKDITVKYRQTGGPEDVVQLEPARIAFFNGIAVLPSNQSRTEIIGSVVDAANLQDFDQRAHAAYQEGGRDYYGRDPRDAEPVQITVLITWIEATGWMRHRTQYRLLADATLYRSSEW
jgi:hypothetical protein